MRIFLDSGPFVESWSGPDAIENLTARAWLAHGGIDEDRARDSIDGSFDGADRLLLGEHIGSAVVTAGTPPGFTYYDATVAFNVDASIFLQIPKVKSHTLHFGVEIAPRFFKRYTDLSELQRSGTSWIEGNIGTLGIWAAMPAGDVEVLHIA